MTDMSNRPYTLTIGRVGRRERTENRHATREAAFAALRDFAGSVYGIHYSELTSSGTLTAPCGNVAAYSFTIR